MKTRTMLTPALLLPFILLGCSHASQESAESGEPQSNAVACGQQSTRPHAGLSFGIPNDFSGKLTEEQEGHVPETLKGAFRVESLRTISTVELAKEANFKVVVAEESHDGLKYIALRDFRHVVFSNEVSGHMIVIERYQVVDK